MISHMHPEFINALVQSWYQFDLLTFDCQAFMALKPNEFLPDLDNEVQDFHAMYMMQ